MKLDVPPVAVTSPALMLTVSAKMPLLISSAVPPVAVTFCALPEMVTLPS